MDELDEQLARVETGNQGSFVTEVTLHRLIRTTRLGEHPRDSTLRVTMAKPRFIRGVVN